MIRNIHLLFVSSTGFLKPSEFPEESYKGICFSVNEVTLGQHLRMGTAWQENQPCDLRVGTFSRNPLKSGAKRGAGGSISHQWPLI